MEKDHQRLGLLSQDACRITGIMSTRTNDTHSHLASVQKIQEYARRVHKMNNDFVQYRKLVEDRYPTGQAHPWGRRAGRGAAPKRKLFFSTTPSKFPSHKSHAQLRIE